MRPLDRRCCGIFILLLLSFFLAGCGGSTSSGGGGTPPATPTGLTATPGNQQITISWNASAGATSYNLSRSTVSGGPYNLISTINALPDVIDKLLTNGTTYYYVVAASNSAGTSANSTQVSATPIAPSNAINVTIDSLTDRHFISPYVYGGAFPQDAATITDSGLPVVRWGGNGASTYNWKLGTTNADNDYFFEDFAFSALNNSADSDSTQFIKDVKTAGSTPLMTMAMLPWVAQSAETSTTQGGSDNFHWSFSVTKYGTQCKVDPFNIDAGDGLKPDCTTRIPANPNDAYFPLLDQPGSGDPTGSVYRNQWAAAMAPAFGNTVACPIPYSTITSCHFYDMDNEIDIWGGTHVDIHPQESGYNELRDTYLKEARALKSWDISAVRFGPVSCCWYFYWNLNSATDNKSTHAGIDFLPWWLNEVAWSDAIAGTRSLDVFDIHAYPDGPDTSNFTATQKQALAVRIYRDWWDPTYTSEASFIQNGGFSVEPIDSKPFRIPRMRALVNQIYPGTPFSITEWSAAFAGESDFSTALGDADAYGILGRERVSLATRWTAPNPANPNYQALKLFTNYDGSHHGFGSISVSATHNADPNLFSVYAATAPGGRLLTLMVINKDPVNAAQTSFTLNGFSPTHFSSYTLSPSSPSHIVASPSQAWSATMTFAPYSATLLAISGISPTAPAVEWDLNPDTIMVPAGGSVTLNPQLVSGTGSLTLGSPTSDAGVTVTVTGSTVSSTQQGSVLVTAGNTPGFYHFSVPASNSSGLSSSTPQGGWIVVGNPAAGLAKSSGDGQTGSAGTTLPQALTVTLTPGQSRGTALGVSILFSTSAGTLSNGASSGAKVIAVTNASGVASVTLTLPGSAQSVTVNAEAPYGLGHAAASFNETAQ